MKEDILHVVRRLGLSLVDSAHDRLKLLQVDLADELDRLGSLLTQQILVALSALFTLQLLSMALLAVIWDTVWRVPVSFALALIAALGTVLVYRTYLALKGRTRSVFASSLEELEKDRGALEKIL